MDWNYQKYFFFLNLKYDIGFFENYKYSSVLSWLKNTLFIGFQEFLL